MVDTVASEQNPFEAWSKLIESTMKENPAMPTTSSTSRRVRMIPGSR